MTPLKPIPPVTADSIPPEWTEIVREIITRDGNAVRASALSPIIEVKSLTTNRWHSLSLPGGGTAFTSYGDRNAVLNAIQNA